MSNLVVTLLLITSTFVSADQSLKGSSKKVKSDTGIKSILEVIKDSSKLKKSKVDLAAITAKTGYVVVNYYTDAACKTVPFVSSATYASGNCLAVGDTDKTYVKLNYDASVPTACTPTSTVTVTKYTDSACTKLVETSEEEPNPAEVPVSAITEATTCSTAGAYSFNGAAYGYAALTCSTTNTALTAVGSSRALTTTYAGEVCTTPANAYEYTARSTSCVTSGTQSALLTTSCLLTVCTYDYNLYSVANCAGTKTGTSTEALANYCTPSVNVDATNPFSVSAEMTVVTAASSSSSDDKVCFAGSSEVAMESGAIKQISDVVVGDRVLAYSSKTQSAVFSDVVAVPHTKNNKVAEFVQITTESGKIVKMTSLHLIQSCEGLVSASKIASGSCVVTVNGQENVVSVEKVVEEGLYTVVTAEEFVVVNGVVASPFAVNHFIPNMFYNFHRVMFGLLPNFLSTKMMDSVATVADEVAQYYTVAADSL